ncbi:isoleucine--tRNA ligase [Mycoplasma marinum]|uniref:Isoleucine--tRNA ligase n=1 Tax=Mycoplasma marinum TaxID=1937190 RepID=A0A4R0XMK3_9MOLU|nr:isoleucine--tRNA ligase [Mycoplasma marinum]TCG11767.1 isoleucine--tRNA ligase [Mycoplasma marinum]
MKKDYKDTLNMPQTNFSMKAGLVEKETKYRQEWLDNEIYKKALEKNKGKEKFIVHDGPPYANGDLHIGHALNKILKDIIVRYKTMNGFYSPFTPGWDTHGLPIENKMLETMNKKAEDFDPLILRKEAEKYALSQVARQQEQFKTLNLLSDLEEKYVTLDKNFEANQLRLFKKMALDGLIYKGLKPVYWSPSSHSALAEAEVEYADHRSPAIFVALDVIKENKKVKKGEKLVIWTTTPWTLIANSGIAVGLSFDYSTVKANGEVYVIATQLIDKVAEFAKWDEFEVLDTFRGKELLGLEYQRPVKKELSAPVIEGHHVTLEAGTGLVHIAPLFGEDDFIIGKKFKLDMIMHVEGDGAFNSEAGELEGMFYEDANKNIGMALDAEGRLLSLKFMKHSYPHDWRTHKPVIYRGVPQWFVSISKIKPQILGELSKIKSYPEWGISRLSQMIQNRDDWTISRQRTWGVPIPVFYNGEKPVIDAEIFDFVIEMVEKNGTNVWWEKEADELLPEKFRGLGYTKEMDIMDVWFDSGSSSIAVKPQGEEAPFDLYLEGSDQYRGWFNSSLINSVAYRGISPFKQLLSHGFVLDGKGNKMSKSKGNVVSPQEIVGKNGADILRLWAANSEFTSDVTISADIIKQNIDIYRNFRTKMRFMHGNLFDFDESMSIEPTGFHAYIAELHKKVKVQIKETYDGFEFNKMIKIVNNFIIKISSLYFEFAKDSLYADRKNSRERRMIQTNIYNILNTLVIALAPILPTTTEEIHKLLFPKEESVHLRDFFKLEKVDEKVFAKWDEYFKLVDDVNKKLEESVKSGLIKRRNEAKVTISTESNFLKSIDLQKLLIVGEVVFGDELKVETFETIKCPRCWNHISINDIKEELCPRCFDVINN